MTERIMPEARAISMHLSDSPPLQGLKILSGFALGLKEARQATGRKPETGEKVEESSHGSWLGAIGYMALLDQIGSCFKPRMTPAVQGNSIEKALSYFTTIPELERQALYALRCAFAHDYSLYNINQKKPQYMHQFSVMANKNGQVVTLPQQPWDGNYDNRNDSNRTIINLEALGDLVEDVCQDLFQFANKGDLEAILVGGSDELIQRYAMLERVG